MLKTLEPLLYSGLLLTVAVLAFLNLLMAVVAILETFGE